MDGEAYSRNSDPDTSDAAADEMSEKTKEPKEGALRVWWMTVIPGSTIFYQEVPDLETAHIVINTLAAYDSHLAKRGFIPELANACGLELCENGEWFEWMDDEGKEIGDLRHACTITK